VTSSCIAVEFIDVTRGSSSYGQVFNIIREVDQPSHVTLVDGKPLYRSEDGQLFLYFQRDVTGTGCGTTSAWVVGSVPGGRHVILWATPSGDMLPIAATDVWKTVDVTTASYVNTSLTLTCYRWS